MENLFCLFVLIHHTLAIFAIEIIAFPTYNLSVVSHLLQVLVLLSDKHLNKIICKKKTVKTLIKSFGCFFIHQKRICIYCLFFHCNLLNLAPLAITILIVCSYIYFGLLALCELLYGIACLLGCLNYCFLATNSLNLILCGS